LRAGMSGVPVARCEYSCAYLLPIAHTRLRVHRAPGIPHALYLSGRRLIANLGRIPPRECEGVAERHCEERSDEAIHSYLLSFLLIHGLLRCARNDGFGCLKIESELPKKYGIFSYPPPPREGEGN
jgi:hypothetical protein